MFESKSFWHAKSQEFVSEYEDASAIGRDGVVAVADGVASAIFSRQWADLLTRGVVENAPDLSDAEGFQSWLADLRRQWLESIDMSKLDWMQRQKLQQVGGAYATLLWVEFYRLAEDDEGNAGDDPVSSASGNGTLERFCMRCFAVGDCCVFHVRDGEVLNKFPLDEVHEFEEDPITICSVNRNRDHLLEFHTLEDTCREGDLIVLASDALAKWAYQQLEAERRVDWEEFWDMDEEAWKRRVADLRALPKEERMRVDDTTLVMLRMGLPVEKTGREDEIESEADVDSAAEFGRNDEDPVVGGQPKEMTGEDTLEFGGQSATDNAIEEGGEVREVGVRLFGELPAAEVEIQRPASAEADDSEATVEHANGEPADDTAGDGDTSSDDPLDTVLGSTPSNRASRCDDPATAIEEFIRDSDSDVPPERADDPDSEQKDSPA